MNRPSDSEMLDWLDNELFEHTWSGTIGEPWSWRMAGPYRHTLQRMRGNSLREAIRAAMAADQGAPHG